MMIYLSFDFNDNDNLDFNLENQDSLTLEISEVINLTANLNENEIEPVLTIDHVDKDFNVDDL